MSYRAVKRQKQDHVRLSSIPRTRGEDSSDSESSEEEVQRPTRRTKGKADDGDKKKRNSMSSATRSLVKDRGPPKSRLRQGEISFSKARPPTQPRDQSPESTQGSLHTNRELEDDLIEDDDGLLNHDGNSRIEKRDHRINRMGDFLAQGPKEQTAWKQQIPFSVKAVDKAQTFQSHGRILSAVQNHGALPWAQLYSPRSVEELGVHKRKIADVRSWIDNVFNGFERKRLLVLRGPPGSGKTATVQALSVQLGFHVLEWRNPTNMTTALGEYQSGTASFEDFLSRGQRYTSLDFHDRSGKFNDSDVGSHSAHPRASRRIILMEEDPSSFSNSGHTLRQFRESILRYLLAEETLFTGLSKPGESLQARPPIVMIISEGSGTSASSISDIASAHRLLGPEILQHPRVTNIEFNPVATTILVKALEQVADRATQDGVSGSQVSPAVLHRLAEGGDLCAAIATLEFMSRRISTTPAVRPSTKRGKGKGKGSAVLTTTESTLIGTLAPRGSTLDLFHAVGKVVYNKRQPSLTDPSQLISEVDIDRVLDDNGTDPSTFVAALHENYALSCAGDMFVDHLNACSEILSEADLLATDPTTLRPAFSSHVSDAAQLRQVDLAAYVAVAGLLYGLPNPVQRKAGGAHTYAGGRDAFKMFYPESVRLRSRMEEVQALVSQWKTTSSRPQLSSTPVDDGLAATSSKTAAAPRSTQAFILTELPYVALIEATRGSQQNMVVLAAMGQLSNSRWGPEDRASRAQVKYGHTQGTKVKAGQVNSHEPLDQQEMGSFIQNLGEQWVLSDDDIVD